MNCRYHFGPFLVFVIVFVLFITVCFCTQSLKLQAQHNRYAEQTSASLSAGTLFAVDGWTDAQKIAVFGSLDAFSSMSDDDKVELAGQAFWQDFRDNTTSITDSTGMWDGFSHFESFQDARLRLEK